MGKFYLCRDSNLIVKWQLGFDIIATFEKFTSLEYLKNHSYLSDQTERFRFQASFCFLEMATMICVLKASLRLPMPGL